MTSVPSPTTVRALIDTGSDLSVVHPQVLQLLGVQATGSVRIRRPGAGASFRLAAMFDIELSIGGVSPGTLWISTRVVGVAPSTPTILALIGRDVLEHCTLFYNGEPKGDIAKSWRRLGDLANPFVGSVESNYYSASQRSPSCNRGDRTPLELFLAGVQSWNSGMRRILSGHSDGVAQS